MIFGNLAHDAVTGFAPAEGEGGKKEESKNGFRHGLCSPR
jgi:hypothetical protein